MNPQGQTLQPPNESHPVQKPRAAKGRARPAKSSAQRAGRASKPKRHKAPAARRGTKTAKILALLGRPDGASLAELGKATGWQAHSVRGFLSGAVKKKMGLRVTSAQREDGERVYRLPVK
jgi:hypothetical protein